jgi:SAM-dependent methyltransferase
MALQRVRRWSRPVWPRALRRTTPLSTRWGWDRGTPIDRRYIEWFLEEHRADIHGRVLEIGDSRYTDRFAAHVTKGDILDINPANEAATLVADLTLPEQLPEAEFDCFLLIQTLQYVFDVAAAVTAAHRLVRSGGIVLATVPAVSRIPESVGVDGDYWRFTAASTRRLFATAFGADAIEVRTYGNVLSAAAFLMGLAAEELSEAELAATDNFFPVLVGVHAVKK